MPFLNLIPGQVLLADVLLPQYLGGTADQLKALFGTEASLSTAPAKNTFSNISEFCLDFKVLVTAAERTTGVDW